MPSEAIPIKFINGWHLDIKDAQAFGRNLSGDYLESEPFHHLVIDDFLPADMLASLAVNFPAQPTDMEQTFERAHTGLHKRQISPYACDPEIVNLFLFFNSAPVLQFLEQLTSITGLIGDSYFSGGGFHETYTGGSLAIHSDFRIKEGVHLERRLNIIIYLNENWQASYGGNLELWDPDMKDCFKSIEPVKNRCVIFDTGENSNHGHPDPLTTPAGISRRSIALYYYTASESVYNELGYSRTLYKARPGDSLIMKLQIKNRERRDRRKSQTGKSTNFIKRLFGNAD